MTYTTLISVDELVQLKQSGSAHVVIVDCRHDLMDGEAGLRAFHAGHIPGAVFAHLDQHLSGEKWREDGSFQGRHPLPEQAALVENLRQLGIQQSGQVIAYDAQGGMFAARLWWLLRSIGYANVAVLDGGLPAWLAASQTLDTALSLPAPGDLQVATALTKQVELAQVVANLSASAADKYQVVDARAPDRFWGENESIDPVGGHIPGAVNRFFKDNLQADGRFKTASQLREAWLAIIPSAAQSIMQCGSGVTACHNLLALEIAGLPGAALYPGSWSQWCADSTRPVATGPADIGKQ
jgi:thiosulfate/3-mercaptopyruvate sulfurtransferase